MVVVGGGPSLTAADVDRAASRPVRIIAINDAWRLAPRADLLYAADAPWWDHHKGVPAFAGAKWIPYRTGGCSFSQGPQWLACAKRWGLRIVRSEFGTRLSFDPALIREGYNSGFQAINVAVLMGAARIVLLGFDCQPGPGGKEHWFGSHPDGLRRTIPFRLFAAAFEHAAADAAAAGVDIVNCSRATALECFRRAALDEVLP